MVGLADQRQDAIDADRWSAVESEARALLKGVAASNLVRRHRLGVTALQTHSMCRQLVRRKDDEHLLPHVQQMKPLNKFARTKAKPSPSPNTPQPQPAPPAGSPPKAQ